MGLFEKVVAVAAGVVGGLGMVALGEKIAENKRKKDEAIELEMERQNTPCYFNNGISYSEFCEIVHNATKHIRRLTVSIEGPIVYGAVRAQSGISTWGFKLDFNDFGDITGNWWLWTENHDSDIPKIVAEHISSEIVNFLD